ncbi:MAG: hypothetical protein KC420_23435, partial [Myxococcales bacterium]|nr:hypothetical protein [Myxococcales bacterium]
MIDLGRSLGAQASAPRDDGAARAAGTSAQAAADSPDGEEIVGTAITPHADANGALGVDVHQDLGRDPQGSGEVVGEDGDPEAPDVDSGGRHLEAP